MNWENILTEIILGIVGIVITTLGTLVSYWIAQKIKDDKVRKILNSINDVVKNSVLEVYQTYVEELKCKNIFDLNAQKLALAKAKELIKTNMSSEAIEWLKTNSTDIEAYIESMIETQIALLKK